MKGSEAETPNTQLTPTASKERRWLVAGACSCILFGGFMAWGIHALWRMDDIRITSTLEEQMMRRKSQTTAEILDGLVHSNMRSVEKSAEHMKSIGVHLNWHSSSELYENNNEQFRQAVLDLIEAAKQRDHDAAKESALRLERSCIECHALINRENNRPK